MTAIALLDALENGRPNTGADGHSKCIPPTSVNCNQGPGSLKESYSFAVD